MAGFFFKIIKVRCADLLIGANVVVLQAYLLI
jgi:hypothetical protein